MFKFLAITIGLCAIAIFGVRRISKLPSRYDRKPRYVNSWNALDQGIDPTIQERDLR